MPPRVRQFSAESDRRIGDTVHRVEGMAENLDSPNQNRAEAFYHRAFIMTERAEQGQPGAGIPAAWNEDANQFEPVPDTKEEPIYIGDAAQSIPVGAPVIADFVRGLGWVQSGESLMGFWGQDAERIPYAVLSVGTGVKKFGGSAGQEKGVHDVLRLTVGTAFGHPYWNTYWVATDGLEREKNTTDVGDYIRCRQVPPSWMAYTTELDEDKESDIPAEVRSAFGLSNEHPEVGELWAPGRSIMKLTRTISLLPLYWYKYIPPPPSCVVNPDYDNGYHSITGEYTNDADYDPNIKTNIDDQGDPEYVWGDTGIQCDPDDPYLNIPPAGDPVCWIAPHGWWYWAPYQDFWGWFNKYPYWGGWRPGWWGVSTWGPMGFNWWGTHYGRIPPRELEDIDPYAPIPQPTGGGELSRAGIYGYVVWMWGWRVLQVIRERKIAFVWGPKQLEVEQKVVVVNATSPC